MKKVLVILLLSAGLILTGVYGLRTLKSYRLLQQAKQQVDNPVLLRSWMTIPYLAQKYNVPEAHLYAALDIPAEGNDKHSLHYIRKNYFDDDVQALLMTVQTAIADYNESGQH